MERNFEIRAIGEKAEAEGEVPMREVVSRIGNHEIGDREDREQ